MSESGKFGLTQNTIDLVNNVFRKHPLIERVVIYGSRAKGNYKPSSDIDITLVSPKMELSELLKIDNEIDDLLLPYKFDISLFHQIDNPQMIEHIKRVGVLFYPESSIHIAT